MNDYFVFGISFAFAAAIQPGPLQSFLITQTLTGGWEKTLIAALAPLLSDIIIICLTLLMLTQLPPRMIQILQLVGGVYLVYLSFQAFRAFRNFSKQEPLIRQSSSGIIMKAAFINLLNPNPYISWSLVLGPLLLKAWHQSPINGIIFLASFYFTLILSLGGTVLLFSLGKKLGHKINRTLLGLSVIALASFGVYQIIAGIIR